ncbi:MAG: hypothetical protein HYR67_07425 [Bacteroidetes bacterium]|nr:hypothetical protein [Bacteroidota bacterium]
MKIPDNEFERMFKKLLIASVVVCSFAVNGFSQVPKTKRYPKVSFAKVSQSKVDTIQFKATVKSIYKCPPCPEGAQCKPCIGDHVMVTDGNSDREFLVFTHQLSLFKVDSSYQFLVRFRSKFHRADNIELVSVLQ